jgi:hypothetical protein
MRFQAMVQVPSTSIASEPSDRFCEVPTCQQMQRLNFPANWTLNWHTKNGNNFILKQIITLQCALKDNKATSHHKRVGEFGFSGGYTNF